MIAETPYSRLLEWAAVEVCPSISGSVERALRPIAQGVLQDLAVAQHVCGLECHHDGSGRFDFSLACVSNLCRFDGLLMPSWWDQFLGACDPMDRNDALQGGLFDQNRIAQLPPAGLSHGSCDVVLPDAHSLEFDRDAEGARLAGVFQWICPPPQSGQQAAPDPGTWTSTWARLPLGGALAQASSWRNGLLEEVRQLLGWPLWAGFMCGRGNLLKLGFQLDARLLERLADFLPGKGLADDGQLYRSALAGCLRDPADAACVSIDLDLATQCLLPALALEYFPAVVTSETRTWKVLDHLSERFKLDPAVVADARRKLGRLPIGIRPAATSQALQSLMPALPLSGAKAAKLSHYKLSMADSGTVWKLKSYLSLTWSRDQNLLQQQRVRSSEKQ